MRGLPPRDRCSTRCRTRTKADGIQIVGIAVDMRPAVDKFLKVTPLHYLVLVGEEEGMEAAQKFGMELALPFTVFADAKNRSWPSSSGNCIAMKRPSSATCKSSTPARESGGQPRGHFDDLKTWRSKGETISAS